VPGVARKQRPGFLPSPAAAAASEARGRIGWGRKGDRAPAAAEASVGGALPFANSVGAPGVNVAAGKVRFRVAFREPPQATGLGLV
jgi:hypothetical protein